MPDHPRYRPQLATVDVVLEIFSAAVIVGSIALLAIRWHTLPSSLPTHFDFAGKPDGWGGRGSLLFLPAMTLALYALLTILARFPWTYSYPIEVDEKNAERLYAIGTRLMRALKLAVSLIFACIEIACLDSAASGSAGGGLGPIFLPAVVVVLAAIVAWSVVAMKKLR
jgi:Protein of unknown function (DUF1648).